MEAKHVARLNRQSAPVDLIAAQLEWIVNNATDPMTLFDQHDVKIDVGGIIDGSVDTIELVTFTKINRECNRIMREHINRAYGANTICEKKFAMLCKVLLSCDNLRSAIEETRDFFALFDGQIGSVRLEIDGDTSRFCMFYAVLRPYDEDHGASALIDGYGLAVMHRLYGWLIGQPLALSEVSLAYPGMWRDASFLSIFDCPVRRSSAQPFFAFPSALLSSPIIRSANDLAGILNGFPFDLMLGFSDRSHLPEQIHAAIMNKFVNNERPTFDYVASTLGTTRSTLRRRLNECQITYSDIKKKCQINIAISHLKNRSLTIEEVAMLSCFSDMTTFRRSFRQWTGLTPSAYREGLGNPHAAAQLSDRALAA